MIVADTGAVYALYDADDRNHGPVRSAFAAIRESVHIPQPCLGELDYLLRTHLGLQAELDFLTEVQKGRFVLEPLLLRDVARCGAILRQYSNLDLGLADASVVATAERLRTGRILTVDYRDFSVLRSADGERFSIVPEPNLASSSRKRDKRPK